MFTRTDAENLGWALTINGVDGHARKGDEQFDVTSDTPLYALLAEIARQEGVVLPDPTPESVAAMSGELYAPDEAVAATASTSLPDSPSDVLVAALESMPADQPVTAAGLVAALKALAQP